jgi:hypothetical protein
MPLGNWEGGATILTREPGDLPVSGLSFVLAGHWRNRGFPPRDDICLDVMRRILKYDIG